MIKLKKILACAFVLFFLLSFAACTSESLEPFVMEGDKDFLNEGKEQNTLSLNNNWLIAVTNDGTLAATKDLDAGSRSYKGISDAVSVHLSSNYFAVLHNDGSAEYLGIGIAQAAGYEEISEEIASWNDIVDIACTDNIVVGLSSNGKLCIASTDEEWQELVSGWRNIISVDVKDNTVVGLRNDGRVFICRKHNGRVENLSPEWNDIVSIHINDGVYAVTKDQKAYKYNLDTKASSEIKEFDSVVKLSGEGEYLCALTVDGTVLTLNGDLKKEVKDWKNIVDISADDKKLVCLTVEGTLLCAGFDEEKTAEYQAWLNIKTEKTQ